MNPTEIIIRVGDMAPPLLWQLLDANGKPFKLAGSNPTVRFALRLAAGGAAALDLVPCTIVDVPTAMVRLDWPLAAGSLDPDLYSGQFIARQDNLETTFPVDATVVRVRVMARLVPQTQRLDLYPSDLHVAVGQTKPASLQAYLTTNGGDPAWVTNQISWSARIDPPLLAVDAAGNVTGIAAGTATVTATLGLAEAQVQVVVTP